MKHRLRGTYGPKTSFVIKLKVLTYGFRVSFTDVAKRHGWIMCRLDFFVSIPHTAIPASDMCLCFCVPVNVRVVRMAAR